MFILHLLLILFYITLVKGVEDTRCVALRNSKVCSAFSQFYIDLSGIQKDYPFLFNTTTIEEFDEGLLNYVQSTSVYLYPLGCLSSNFNKIIPYARYSLSRLCASVIQSPYSLSCNYEKDISPPPLCKNTCLDWVDDIKTITNDPKVCVGSLERNMTIERYKEECNTWLGFNGTVNENCISGIANEPYNCGFGNDSKYGCHYCSINKKDECCLYIKCNRLSKGEIAGITIGSIVFTVILILLFYYYYNCHYNYKRKRNNHINNNRFMPSTTSSTTVIASNNHLVEKNNFEMNNIITKPTIEDNTDLSVVNYPYSPQVEDELKLNIGDIICIVAKFDDGWALGFNLTTNSKGAFPLVCTSTPPKESLNRLLNPNDFNPFRNSIISNNQKSFDYSDNDSPLSPTIHTPFFSSS